MRKQEGQWLEVVPLLKNPSMDSSNYHLVSNLLFLGKVIEREVAEQLQFPR